MTIKQIEEQLNKEFFLSAAPIQAIVTAYEEGQNVLLYGPKGHAKSAMFVRFLELLLGDDYDAKVHLENFCQEMAPEPFVGVLNMQAFQQGRLEFVLEDTVYTKKEYLILEEGLDGPKFILNGMKQPLMSKYMCGNGSCIPVTLRMGLMATNIDPYEWAKTSSDVALLDRFMFRTQVMWPEYSEDIFADYLRFIGHPNLFIAKVAAMCRENGFLISPRAVKVLATAYNRNSQLSRYAAFDEFNKHPELFALLLEQEALSAYLDRLSKAETIAAELNDMDLTNPSYATKLIQLEELIKFEVVTTEDSFTKRLANLVRAKDAFRSLHNEHALRAVQHITL